MMFGLPNVITSDQGSEFNNKMDKRLMKMLTIEHRLTTPYHPQVCVCLGFPSVDVHILLQSI